MGNLVHKDFGFELDWSFFEIAHGKRPAGGIGATVKQWVWMKILQSKAVVNIAKEFFVLSKHLNDNITILFVSAQENE